MRIILFTCAIVFFAACSKEEQNTADVNLNIYGPTLQAFIYEVSFNGNEIDSKIVHVGGYTRHWFGYKPNNSIYAVKFEKQEKYDTGYVDFIWRNGDKEILNASRFYMDTLTFKYESSLKF